MATNSYIQYNVASEQELYEDLIIEALQIYGNDLYYLPRTIVDEDRIFGDDIPSKFNSAYIIEMYIENVEGFGGEGDLFSRFGIEVRDQATFVVAKKRWVEAVSNVDNDIDGDRPREGDLVYFPLSKSLFEIMRVEREDPFYQLSQLPTYKLVCELFEYSDEKLDTGIEEIDAVETLGYEVILTFDSDSDAAGVFEKGSTILQTLDDGTVISAEITDYDRTTQKLYAAHVSTTDGEFHLFTEGSIVLDSDTSATKIIRSISQDISSNDPMNDDFGAVDFLVFDENNPFGSPE